MLRHLLFAVVLAQASALATSPTPPPTPEPPPVTPKKPAKPWPAEVTKVLIPASDGEAQPAMWYAPATPGKKPLLVGLHTWSSHYASAGGDAVYADWCIAQGWAFVHPHFRGPNLTPQALGSDRAVLDIIEAVAWAKQQTDIDASRIYLIGVSGGGHMALLMAGRHPELWAGVSAWVGISDIAQWHHEHLKEGKPDRYAQNIEAALGHAPTADDAEAHKRSPLTYLKAAASVPLDIGHGIHDGRKGSVPFSHSLLAFNAVVPETERLPEADIASYYATQQRPDTWPAAAPDASFGQRLPLFRKTVGNTRVTLFEGGHEIIHQAALNWLAKQRQGQPATWDIGPSFISIGEDQAESGK